jgi:hypothetical protein
MAKFKGMMGFMDVAESDRSLQIVRLRVMIAAAGLLIAGCHSRYSTPPPSVSISRVPPATVGGPERMDPIEGSVTGAKPGQKIVLYTRDEISWWVQPFADHPLSSIRGDSTWKASTHLGREYAALLVDPGFDPQPKLVALPARGNGVVAVAAIKGAAGVSTAIKTLHFSGYDWIVRSAPNERGGEFNEYDPENAWVDEKGYLHLRMGQHDGRWSCAEVNLTRSLGYGTYKFIVQDSAHLSESAVLGIFTLDERLAADSRVELDIELSQWGRPGNKNAQYVVQPYYIPQNIARFAVPSGEFTHVMRWDPGSAAFKTVKGSSAGTEARAISEHVFTSGIPAAAGETVHIDLYDFYHSKVTSERPAEVVIEKFEYLP